MFTCLKEDKKNEMMVLEGMSFSMRRRRFTLVEENRKSKKETILLNGKIISTRHPKFYVVEFKSKFQNRSYVETYQKDDFKSKIEDQIIMIG